MTLAEYLPTAACQPWKWGSHDCCTFVAGWVLARGHADPMAFIRGSYDTQIGALRAIREGGGLVPLWTRGMADAGLLVTPEPRAGDVGIIPADEHIDGEEVAAICTGPRWAALAFGGIVVEPTTPLLAWRVR